MLLLLPMVNLQSSEFLVYFSQLNSRNVIFIFGFTFLKIIIYQIKYFSSLEKSCISQREQGTFLS